jgi:FkbM family methyltransferase
MPNTNSYSGAGEEVIAYDLIQKACGTYVDVGANVPDRGSNTYLFYEQSWSGVCIEPIQALYKKLLQQRPRDRHLNVAASDHDGRMLFYECLEEHDLSTLSAEIAEDLRSSGYTVTPYEIPVRTLASLAIEYGIEPPDLLSIDVEGHERQVLTGTPFDVWRPKVIIVEATVPRTMIPSESSWEPILLGKGYRLHTMIHVNRLYIPA